MRERLSALAPRTRAVLWAALLAALPGCASEAGDGGGPARAADGSGGATRVVTDSRGVAVQIPSTPLRVATVSDGLVEEVMIVLGVAHRLVGIGSTCLVREFRYEYETASGSTFTVSGGMGPARYLMPALAELPHFVASGTEPNYEALAALEPDLVIVDVGACTLPWQSDPEAMRRGLARLESLGIPTVVLQGPNSGGAPGPEGVTRVLGVLGDVFGKPEEAARLAATVEEPVRWVRERTRDIPADERAQVLLLGLDPRVRGQGTVGRAFGTSDAQSYLLEEIVGATNAYRRRAGGILSLEQLLALDPDVIILPTSNGYHPPRELVEGPSFRGLGTLRAIRDERVGALPWSPCNCDKRLEYPLDALVMAKTVYPERFRDLDLAERILRFYQDAYGVDEETASNLLDAQWLGWTREDAGHGG